MMEILYMFPVLWGMARQRCQLYRVIKITKILKVSAYLNDFTGQNQKLSLV